MHGGQNIDRISNAVIADNCHDGVDGKRSEESRSRNHDSRHRKGTENGQNMKECGQKDAGKQNSSRN